jgi:hypothetical protein
MRWAYFILFVGLSLPAVAGVALNNCFCLFCCHQTHVDPRQALDTISQIYHEIIYPEPLRFTDDVVMRPRFVGRIMLD